MGSATPSPVLQHPVRFRQLRREHRRHLRLQNSRFSPAISRSECPDNFRDQNRYA